LEPRSKDSAYDVYGPFNLNGCESSVAVVMGETALIGVREAAVESGNNRPERHGECISVHAILRLSSYSQRITMVRP
jgi:hypothetical protein